MAVALKCQQADATSGDGTKQGPAQEDCRGRRTRLDHQRKLELELAKADPDSELIEFWQREIDAAKRIARLNRRLERNW